MSFSKYPNQLDDDASLPKTVDLVTPVKAEVVNRLRDAVIAAQTELGTNPSGTLGTVKTRLDDINSLISTISIKLNTAEVNIGSLQSDVSTLQSQVEALTEIVNVSNQVIIPIVSGIEDTDSSTLTTIGAGTLQPENLGHPNSTFTLEVILQTTDSSHAADFELFNITEGTAVLHPAISTTSSSATFISVTLTVRNSDLPANQVNLLEGRIKLGSGADPSDRAICKYAAIRVTP